MRVLFLAGCFCFAVFWYRCHHRYVAGLITVFGIWFARYFDAVRTWIGFLGTDSLSEAQCFDWTEASFFLQTLSSILVPVSLHKWLETVGIAVVLVAVLVGAVKVLSRRSRRRITRRAATYSALLLGCMGMGVAVSYPISQVVGRIQSNSSLYEGVRAHFSENAAKLDLVRNGAQGLRVVVYIGESTTAMHWGLYGYPVKTTSRLQAFAATHPGFLKFSHVMSTHTHTSPSLLQALSFGMSEESVYQRIYDARRASLVDVLARAGIPSLLLSAQGASGTYNLASSIIFSSVTERHFANPGSVLLGNMATIDQVPDGVFFHDVLGKFKAFHSEGTAVAFLHSYAGHGPYAENLPESSRLPLDPMFRGARPEDLFGSLQSTDLMDDLAAYDSAMRYIDTNVAQVMEQAADATEPTVVLYFSDHGDSVGTARGHDSSRLQHEMMRVPFLMYFNEAAKRVAPDLYARFQEASHADRPATLNQVPATIMTLVGYQVRGVNAPGVGIGLDPVESLVPVLVRGAPGNAAYIRSHGATHEQQPDAVDVTDPVTAIWLNRRIGNAENLRPALCYSDANTWAKANRGSMVANCLSVALNLHEGRLDAVPGGSGWTLSAIARMAMSRDVTLWMDASKLPADQACAAILDWKDQPIDESSTNGERKARQWMLELKLSRGRVPASCKQLQDSGVTLLLRVPTDLNDPAQAADWVASAVERGWPVSYSVALGQDLAALPTLLGQPGAQWTLNGVPAESLPWKAVDQGVTAGLPAPMMLGVETDWDVNSRAVLAR